MVTQMTARGKPVLSLVDLEAYDPHFHARGEECRFLCPLPACQGKRNRNLTVNVADGKWRCMRCQARGLLREHWSEHWTERPLLSAKERRRVNAKKAFSLDSLDALDAVPKPVRPVKPMALWARRLGDLILLSDTPGAAYLTGRGLDLSLCHRAKVKYSPNYSVSYDPARPLPGFAAVVFPVVDQAGKTVAAVGRALRGSGKITFGTKSAGVFITPGALDYDLLVITEAPIDALSLATCSVPAIAVAGTDGYPDWLLRRQAFGGSVVAAFDNDEPGNAAAERLMVTGRAIGATVTRLAPPSPFKDWNECLQRWERRRLADYLYHYSTDCVDQLHRNKEMAACVAAAHQAALATGGDRAAEWLEIVTLCREIRCFYGDGWHTEPEGREATRRLHVLAEAMSDLHLPAS